VERALAANAAHELRTPLAAARLRLQTALDHDLKREDVQGALQALQMLSHRTEKLLQLSRAESGASLTRARVDLVQLAGTVAQEFWQDPLNNERLKLKVPDSAAPVAFGDVDALAIALRNLVENALRYGGGGRVVIEVATPCTLVVRDFGAGVNAAQLKTLQQRHVRHGSDRAGYGLGLSIVGTIVEKHNAKLELARRRQGRRRGSRRASCCGRPECRRPVAARQPFAEPHTSALALLSSECKVVGVVEAELPGLVHGRPSSAPGARRIGFGKSKKLLLALVLRSPSSPPVIAWITALRPWWNVTILMPPEKSSLSDVVRRSARAKKRYTTIGSTNPSPSMIGELGELRAKVDARIVRPAKSRIDHCRVSALSPPTL
jgi:anti-sigma regulatory factor (Ser/Thr protein kinase)